MCALSNNTETDSDEPGDSTGPIHAGVNAQEDASYLQSKPPLEDPSVAADQTESTSQTQVTAKFPIVGLGASAGGLEALEQFFQKMPSNSGMAFVVVQHLSPDFKSLMDELLARHTDMPIHRVTDSMRVEPNQVYLIPPKKEMIISDGKLFLSDKDPDQGFTLPIDIFFRSLAQDVGIHAVGIVLSGTGSDGANGICAIHEQGGFVIAQALDSAKFDGMPKSAIETKIVDLILRPEQMASALLTQIKHPAAAAFNNQLGADPISLKGFDAIFQLLRQNFDLDFSYYKPPTVMRRVQRRLQMNKISDLEEYVQWLRRDPHEIDLLYKDLLIGVTNFFRDPDAFQVLEERVLPELLEKLKGQPELRVWVAGCATGEEAYSLAILIKEKMKELQNPPVAKIFATDVHRASLDIASMGVYSEESLSGVSDARLREHFTRVKEGYRVSPELRQMIVFAPHNLIKDAPFTKMDLVSCRNLLIYFEPSVQKKVISLFHFSLKKEGVLFMGPSESPGELMSEFDHINDRWKLYSKRRDRHLPPDMRLPISSNYSAPNASRHVQMVTPHRSVPEATMLRAYDLILNEFAPTGLLINDRRELVQSFSGASKYLQLRDGRPSQDVFEIIIPELKMPLATAVQQASTKGKSISVKGVHIGSGENEQTLTVTVKPLPDQRSDRDYYLICLEPQENKPESLQNTEKSEAIDVQQASRDQYQSMEMELVYTRENLQATVEELETSNEELQATNEELVASNEELQSTNEELHSVNEELYTVNAEYQKKISELTEMTADMNNLLHSTEVGVIFLDRDFCIRKYTPKIGETFHLMPVDIGRRIDNFTHNLRGVNLLELLKEVLKEEEPQEREVYLADDQQFLLRILPYWSDSKVDGVVVTLIDISQLKETETKLRLMSKVFLEGADSIVIESLDGQVMDMNAEAERVFGWKREELIGKHITTLVPPDERQRAMELRERCLEKGGLRNVEVVKWNRQEELIPVLLTLSVLTDDSGVPHAIASIPKDISDLKAAETKARTAVRNRDYFLAMLSHELRNPLGAALNASYLLDHTDGYQMPEPVQTACRVVQSQTKQVARLLDDLLDVSRVTQGKIDFRKEVVDMTHLVEDAVSAVKFMFENKKHELDIDLSPQPLYVHGDPARLLQIQENLLANAAKYTPQNGKISLSLKKEDDEAILRVIDNGKGISSHMLENIFELFVQSDETLDRAQGGMGIGLTLVKTLVELHGGQIKAYSKGPNQGSEFVVRLPLCSPPSEKKPVETASKGGKPQQSHTRQIVLVEDNHDSGKMLAALLKTEGHQVDVATSGQEGFELIQEKQPEVGIIDIGLPGMNGYEVAQKVRTELGKEIYLIALTGYGRSEDKKAAYESGFNMHLVKPVDPDELAKLLNSDLDSNKQTQ